MQFRPHRAAIYLAAFVALTAVGTAATAQTVVLRPSTLAAEGWGFISEGDGDGTVEFVDGPATPPAGDGSVQFVLADAGDAWIVGNSAYAGVAFADLTELSYCTYVTNAPGPQAVALQVNVDSDVTDADTSWEGRLVFEPYHNGAVTLGAWQCWDALAGNWWATGGILGIIYPQSAPATLATILATFPNAGFNSSFGGLGLKAGSGWDFFDGNADNLTIAFDGTSTTFDFEADGPALPTDKAQCKKGGWKDFGFRNQGQCIRYVNTGKL